MSEIIVIKFILQAILFVFLLFSAILLRWLLSVPKKWLYLFVFILPPVFAWLALTTWLENEKEVEQYARSIWRFRDQYPVLSLEERLPLRAGTREVKLTEASQTRLNDIEKSNEFDRVQMGEMVLKRIHEGSVEDFVRSMGFGYSRMPFVYIENSMYRTFEVSSPLPQPADNPAYVWKRWYFKNEHDADDGKPRSRGFASTHAENVLDFVLSKGFGYIKDKKQVAGFLGHQFSQVHEPETWMVERLELVGLLKADQPRVYVSDFVPNMELLRQAKTRPLDFFEAEGLVSLENGDDLFFREDSGGLRMLGAVRTVKQCLKCHDGERGEMLGAFSYRLAKKLRLPGLTKSEYLLEP